jgi:hypothetical protein
MSKINELLPGKSRSLAAIRNHHQFAEIAFS